MNPPFNVGDIVNIKRYYVGKIAWKNNVNRKVLSVKRNPQCVSGWLVFVDGPNFHKPEGGIAMDSGWFILIKPEKDKTKNIIRKIINSSTMTDKEIDISFQRHVTKADLIRCIRKLLPKEFI